MKVGSGKTAVHLRFLKKRRVISLPLNKSRNFDNGDLTITSVKLRKKATKASLPTVKRGKYRKYNNNLLLTL